MQGLKKPQVMAQAVYSILVTKKAMADWVFID